MSTESERSHLLIGMVMADLFLVVLLIVWWGFESLNKEPPKLGETELQAQVLALQTRVRTLEDEVREKVRHEARARELEALLKRLYVKAGYGSAPVGSVGADEVLAGLRRGAPACDAGQRNVVILVSAGSDSTEARILSSDFLRQIAAESLGGTGSQLGNEQIDLLLARVRAFYQTRRVSKQECRFDYRLEWRTDGAYRAARERFERYFYPAGIVQKS